MRYITLDYANEYITPDPYIGTKWTALSDEQKTAWIDFVEQQVENIRWIGSKVDPSQDNEFPRLMTPDARQQTKWDTTSSFVKEQLAENEETVPDELYKAICESIINWFRTKKFKTLQDLQQVNVDNFSAGSAAFDFGDKGTEPPLPMPAWHLIVYFTRWFWMNPSITWLERV